MRPSGPKVGRVLAFDGIESGCHLIRAGARIHVSLRRDFGRSRGEEV
jgi:hypothetical protein